LEVLEIENVRIFYCHLEYITAIWYTLRPFGILYGHFGKVYISPFWYFVSRKIWQPCLEAPFAHVLAMKKSLDS
jgi:hypothetical protein